MRIKRAALIAIVVPVTLIVAIILGAFLSDMASHAAHTYDQGRAEDDAAYEHPAPGACTGDADACETIRKELEAWRKRR